MKLSKTDPYLYRKQILLIHCPYTLDEFVPTHPEDADGVLAYCFLDPLRGYRLLICAVVRCRPYEYYPDYHISLDVAYASMGGARAMRYPHRVKLDDAVQRMIYEVNQSTIENLMQRLAQMDIDGWKITRTK